jgi:hypothetical protein
MMVITLDASTYKLTGETSSKSGTTLNIPAGTKIEGTGGTASYSVAQGGKLNVNGTAE